MTPLQGGRSRRKVKSDPHVRIRQSNTLVYNGRQYYELRVTVPMAISRSLRLKKGNRVRCTFSRKQRWFKYTIVPDLASHRILYQDWLGNIKRVLNDSIPRTYEEIRRKTRMKLKTPPAIWVRQAAIDIGLHRWKDAGTGYRVMWTLDEGHRMQQRYPGIAHQARAELVGVIHEIGGKDRTTSREAVPPCPSCKGSNIKKKGLRPRLSANVQQFQCLDCQRIFRSP